jgi:hypothetical protein
MRDFLANRGLQDIATGLGGRIDDHASKLWANWKLFRAKSRLRGDLPDTTHPAEVRSPDFESLSTKNRVLHFLVFTMT